MTGARKTTTVVLGLVLALAAWTAPAAAQDEAAPSLYDRLGGVYNIAMVVDDLINRVVEDEVLNANPAIYAARVPARFPGLKYQLTSMVCQATGGPCAYIGMSMKETHADMAITEAEWQALVADFKASLDHFGVGQQEQDELFAIVGSTKADIVAAAE